MITNERNKENRYDDDDKRKNAENRLAEDRNNENDADADEGTLDLDGDGLIGNTGGFYGGTSYLGSNYGEGWNKDSNEDQNKGNFGAAGQRDATDDDQDENPPHFTKDDRVI